MSYGDQSNDSLLQFYGFVEADNPLDCYMVPDFVARARAAAAAQGIPVRSDVPADTTYDARLTRDGLGDDAIKVLSGLLVQPSPDSCRKVGLAPRTLARSLTRCAQDRLAAAQVAYSVCADELAGLRRAQGQRRQLGRGKGEKASRGRLAAEFRKEKQAVLQACLTRLER